MKSRNCILVFTLLLATPIATGQSDGPGSVQGLVSTLWGDPIEEAEVSFYLLEWEKGKIVSAEGRLVQSVVTDKQGQYKVGNLPWGQYRIRAELRGLGSAEAYRFYLWRGADRVFDIGIPIGYDHHLSQITISGAVSESTQIAVPDATVTLVCAFDSGRVDQQRTNKDGRYEFKLIQPGQYILYAAKPGFLVSTMSVDLGNGSQETRGITLQRGKPKYVQRR
jgi:hypothetical protein